jgi:hypothetical protein
MSFVLIFALKIDRPNFDFHKLQTLENDLNWGEEGR